MLEKFFSMFKGKNEAEQIEVMKKLLKDQGFTETEITSKGKVRTIWYEKDGVENVFAVATSKRGRVQPIVMPKDFAKSLYAENGEFKRLISLVEHSTNAVCARYKSVGLHHVLYEYCGKVVPEGMQLDHKGGHQGIILIEELRIVTDKQNKYNKPGRKTDLEEVGNYYDENHDFRNSFWIPFLHYVLGVIESDDMAELRKMELGVA